MLGWKRRNISFQNLNLKEYTDKTPYSIMFGPDKCGMTTKIHAIFRFNSNL